MLNLDNANTWGPSAPHWPDKKEAPDSAPDDWYGACVQ